MKKESSSPRLTPRDLEYAQHDLDMPVKNSRIVDATPSDKRENAFMSVCTYVCTNNVVFSLVIQTIAFETVKYIAVKIL